MRPAFGSPSLSLLSLDSLCLSLILLMSVAATPPNTHVRSHPQHDESSQLVRFVRTKAAVCVHGEAVVSATERLSASAGRHNRSVRRPRAATRHRQRRERARREVSTSTALWQSGQRGTNDRRPATGIAATPLPAAVRSVCGCLRSQAARGSGKKKTKKKHTHISTPHRPRQEPRETHSGRRAR